MRSPRLRLAALGAVLLLAAVPEGRGQAPVLRGFVTDEATGEAVAGATVALDRLGGTAPPVGAITNDDGFYQLAGFAPGRYALRIRHVGYAPFADTLGFSGETLATRTVALVPAREVLDEVVVETEGGPATVEAGVQSIRPADLARLPTPDVTGDLAGYLQSMPGIVALGDRGGQLYVRGGTPDQNLVHVDGLLVYQPFHIIGFFSAFPEDLIASADVYAGGFGARHHGRLASVIDVTLREGNKQRPRAAVTVSPFLASARLEGPLVRGKLSFIASARASTIEAAGPAYLDGAFPYRFGDQYAKLHLTQSDNRRLSILALRTYDRGRIDPRTTDDAFRWENLVVGGRYLVFPTTLPVFGEISTGYSQTTNEVGVPGAPARRSTARQLSTDAHLSHYLRGAVVRWGVFARSHIVDYALDGLFQDLDEARSVALESGLYGEGEIERGRLTLLPGVVVGGHVFRYPLSIEPRLRLRYAATSRQTLSAAAGLYRQALVGLQDERDVGSAFTAWTLAPTGRRQARALHLLGGWNGHPRPWLRLTAEAYHKRFTGLQVPIWSSLARFTTRLTDARGTTSGLDARLEVQRRRSYLFVGYGLARTTYQSEQAAFSEWFGRPVQRYAPPHDRRHQLTAVVSRRGLGADWSLRWQYGSGLPYTAPLGFDDWVDLRDFPDVPSAPVQQRLLYDRPYGARQPAYHRLDVAVERAVRFGGGRLTLRAGAVNLYNRRNLFYFDLFTAQRVDQLPRIPYLSIRAETL